MYCVFAVNLQAYTLEQSGSLEQIPQSKNVRITYCVDPHWAPYESIRNNTHVGISAEYMKTISELSGITFDLIPTNTWAQSLEYVQAGTCQMLSMLNKSDYRKQFLDFSLPYFEAPNILVARSGSPVLQGYAGIGDRLVGVVKGYRQVEYISRYYPEIRMTLISNEREGLVRLSNGDFDVMVGSLMSVNTHINNQNLNNLVIVGYAEPLDSLSFGVNKASGYIIPALNHAISQLPESRKVEIYRHWNNVHVRYQHDYFKLIMTIVSILLILTWLMWRNRIINVYNRLINQKNKEIKSLQASLADRNRTLEFLSAHDTLTGLYNRNHMIQKAEEEICRFKRFNTSASLIVVEMKNEQQDVAESLGLDKDEMLKYVADKCLTIVREVDILSRFSSDQIIILCPQTQMSACKILADRLILSLKNDTRLKNAKWCFAIGLSELHENEAFPEWLNRTTKALHQSKRQGYGFVSTSD